jgi:outer membrane receptor protein involved in Fe transport
MLNKSMLGTAITRALAATALGLLLVPSIAWAQQRAFDIPAADAATALPEYARQAGVQIIAPGESLKGVRTPAIKGNMDARAALRMLLAGTGLKPVADDGRTITLMLASSAPPPSSPAKPPVHTQPTQTSLDAAPAAPVRATERSERPVSAEGLKANTLTAVIVTANRRQQELKDFAGSVTPMTAEQLDRVGAVRMEDYLTRTPSVSFTEGQPGQANVTIRGVGTTVSQDQGQASTGLFINDIPLTEPVFSFVTPDIDTFDVNRVEVLRGPQGTAFGSGTLGGAVNYITNTPQQGVTEGRIQLGLSNTDHSQNLSHEVKAMVNFPVTDRLAVRAVVALRNDAGFLDNLGTGTKGSNDSTVQGGRFLASWDLTDNSRLEWMSLYQKIKNEDAFADRSDLGRYKRTGSINSPFETSVELHNLKYTHYFSPATLTVSLTRKKKAQATFFDLSTNQAIQNIVLGGKTGPAGITQTATMPGTNFEVRLTSADAPTARFEWSMGLFYDKTKEDILVKGYAKGAAASIETAWAPVFGAGIGNLSAPNDVFYYIGDHPVGNEQAVFGEATWHFADAWKLTLGGRYFKTKIDLAGERGGILGVLGGAPAFSTLEVKQNESGFSPKVVLAYSFNDNNMAYGLASRGFRYGGPNPNPPNATAAGATFDSDQLWNYELGYRTSSANGAWAADFTLFRIDWSNIQLRSYTAQGLAYAFNAGNARINGLEASATWRPSARFDWTAMLTLTDAQTETAINLTTAPLVVVPSGTTLPGASKTRFATAMTYHWEGDHAPFLTAAYRYASRAPAQLDQQSVYQLGGFGVLDLRAGFSVNDKITLTGYVSNASNRYGVTNAGDAQAGPGIQARTMIRPRTIGLVLDARF